MTKILIIGGSGFVGTALINILGRDKCIILDKKISIKYPEITVLEDIRIELNYKPKEKINFIIHLAAEHTDDVYPISNYYNVNVNGTNNVLKFMNLHSINHLIFFSSVAVYGLHLNNCNENFTPNPFNDYGKSKLEAENLIKSWYFSDLSINKYVTIIRPTVIFGENNRGNVYNLINQIINKNMFFIGKGTNLKSIAYVKNIVYFVVDII
ncbi:MAG: NAD(P)-dependent oxidoreductase, partial [Silvanigrellaceae bacterium]|nr:NAD(P)-dependent oxidoreductase [Silvanigrellaceae bacterium]